MADSPSSDNKGDSTTIKLRRFQLLLKREDGLNTYYDQQYEKLPSDLEKEYENFLHVNKILLAYHMYSINNAGLSLKPTVFESLRANPQSPEKRPAHIKYDQQLTDKYQDFFLYFQYNLDNLSKICLKVVKEKKELIDIFTFSVIPGFFAFFSTKGKVQQFLKFMKSIFKYDESIGCIFSRIVFVLPDFRFFLNKIIEKLKIQVHTLTNEDIPNFVTDFCNCFQKYIDFCPRIVKNLMSLSKDENTFLNESFLIPAFTYLRQFGLIPYDTTIESNVQKQLEHAIITNTSTFVQIIKEASGSTSLACICDIGEESPYVESTFLFTYYDLLCINQMTDVTFSDGVHIEKVSNIGFSEPSDFSVFVLKYFTNDDKKSQSVSVQISSIDELESSLRTLLTHVNDIPVGTEGNTIEDVLDKQTLLFSEDKRLRLRLKVEELKKCMQRVIDDGNTYSFDELIDLMRQRYEERDKERKKEVFRLSSLSTKIKSIKQFKDRLESLQKAPLLNLFQYQLIEKWAIEKKPLTLITDSIYQSSQQFVECFLNIGANFNRWLSSNGFQEISDYSIIHNFVMSSIPLEKFLEFRPDLRAKDQAFYTRVRDRKDELLENVCEDWMKPLLNNKKLVEPLLNTINSLYVAKTPIEKLTFINKLRKKADQITSREGINEIGADQQLPVVLMTMILSQPKHYLSNLEYIDYFYTKAREVCPIMQSEQTEYSMALMSSLPEHKILKENIDDNQGQN